MDQEIILNNLHGDQSIVIYKDFAHPTTQMELEKCGNKSLTFDK